MIENYSFSNDQAAMNDGIQLKESEERGLASKEAVDERTEAIAEDTRSAVNYLKEESEAAKAVLEGFAQVPPESPATPEPLPSRHGFNLEVFALNMAANITGPIPLLSEESTGKLLIARKGISLVYGAAKSRKTTFCLGLAAAALGDRQLGIVASCDNLKVLLVDTEQDSDTVIVNARKVNRRMGWDEMVENPRFLVRHLLDPAEGLVFKGFEQTTMRETEKKKRLLAFEDMIEKYQPDLIILDGVVDLCSDFNGNGESSDVVTALKIQAENHNCHIISCLHTNKDRITERGHLGAIYKQKGQNAFRVDYYNELYSTVTPPEDGCRFLRYQPFMFGVRDDGLPYRADDSVVAETKKKREETVAKVTKWLQDAFKKNGGLPMRRIDLAKALVDVTEVNGEPISEATGRSYVDRGYKMWGLLEKNTDGNYFLKVNDSMDGTQQILAFGEENEEYSNNTAPF